MCNWECWVTHVPFLCAACAMQNILLLIITDDFILLRVIMYSLLCIKPCLMPVQVRSPVLIRAEGLETAAQCTTWIPGTAAPEVQLGNEVPLMCKFIITYCFIIVTSLFPHYYILLRSLILLVITSLLDIITWAIITYCYKFIITYYYMTSNPLRIPVLSHELFVKSLLLQCSTWAAARCREWPTITVQCSLLNSSNLKSERLFRIQLCQGVFPLNVCQVFSPFSYTLPAPVLQTLQTSILYTLPSSNPCFSFSRDFPAETRPFLPQTCFPGVCTQLEFVIRIGMTLQTSYHLWVLQI